MRRAGFATSAVCGVALMGLSVGGMATLDDRLEAAVAPPADDRVVLELRDGALTVDGRHCDRPGGKDLRQARSGDSA